jgi:hypothetical protein
MKKALAVAALLISVASLAFAEPCLIVKHKGTVGRRLMWTALIGVPIAPGASFDYVDSVNYPPSKMSFGGKELKRIQESGTHVIVLDKVTADQLTAAKSSCAGPVPQAQASVPVPAPAPAKVALVPVNATAPEAQGLMLGATVSGLPSAVGITEGDPGSLGDVARRSRELKARKALDDSSPR